MTITITYRVNKDLYHAADFQHDIALITTEYKYGNELLVHLKIGKNLGIRLNNRFCDLLPKGGTGIQNEQYLFKKRYNQGASKLITRSNFDAKISRFDMSQTVIEREILEEYTYTDKNGLPDHVQIVITDKADTRLARLTSIMYANMKTFLALSGWRG